MLKAVRQALLDEVVRGSELVQGANFTNLYNFVSLLADVSIQSVLRLQFRSRTMLLIVGLSVRSQTTVSS